MVAPNHTIFQKPSSIKLQIESSISTTQHYLTKSYLNQKYSLEKLSARQIGVLNGCSHSVINRALKANSILAEPRESGWIRYGTKMQGGLRVPHIREKQVIQSIVQKRLYGWTYRKISDWLKQRGVKSPNGQTNWYHTTVKRIYELELSYRK